MMREGLPRERVAEETGFSYGYMRLIAKEHGLEPKKTWVPRKPYVRREALARAESVRRAEAMAFLYQSGKTLEEIGKEFGGISRERVRQIIKELGVTGRDGGQAIRAEMNRDYKRARREAASMSKHGCSVEQYDTLVANGATRAWASQKNNANHRNIGWELNLWQWWRIWDESGRWADRGRGAGKYVMARIGDEGPYSVGNVEIMPAMKNNSDAQAIRRAKGLRAWGRKLTIDQVREIRIRYGMGETSLSHIMKMAEDYGVTYQTVYQVASGKTWRGIK